MFRNHKSRGAATLCLAVVVVAVMLSGLWPAPAHFTAEPSEQQTAPVAFETEQPTEQLVDADEPVQHEAAAGPIAEVLAELTSVPPVDTPEATATPDSAPAKAERQKRVGIQAGHWNSADLPAELASLRTSTGTSGGGVPEWRLNLDVARKVAALLEAEGVIADVLPATVPAKYQADAFVALHADGSASTSLSGYKLARSPRSVRGAVDDALLNAISQEYRAATGLRLDAEHVSRNMTGYYAFASRNFQHSIAASTPAVILEMGFMTNPSDLRFMLNNQETVARGIAQGVLRFLAAN